MKPLNSPTRQLVLSLVWFLCTVAMIPVAGFTISTIWNWFMPVVGLPAITWLQAYCIVFALKVIFGSSNESEITKDIKDIIAGTCTEYDDFNIPDAVMIVILSVSQVVITSALYLIIGWVLSYFLYL